LIKSYCNKNTSTAYVIVGFKLLSERLLRPRYLLP
jgi:hypothetical protein